MLKAVLLLLIIGIVSAYPYHDFVWESSYRSPAVISDNLLSECSSRIDFCSSISSNLSTDQQKALILDAINPSSNYPNYSFISSWNSNISFTKFPPFGTTISNSGSIHDAWIRIIDLWPSVQLNNQTLLNHSGTIRSEFGFTFAVPDHRLAGDCRTEYLPQGYDYTLNTLLNGIKINSNNLRTANYSLSTLNNSFQSTLWIESNYLIKRYQWVTHCDLTGCWVSCDYYRTDNTIDRLNISDYKTAQLYNFINEAKSTVDWQQKNLTNLWYSVNLSKDFSFYDFKSGTSILEVKGMSYQIMPTFAPYDILTYQAVPVQKQTSEYGISVLNNTETEDNSTYYQKTNLLLPTSENCTLNIGSHFEEFQYPNFCNYTNSSPNLSLSLVSRANDTLTLRVSFSQEGYPLIGKNIRITFGSIQTNVLTSSEGNATFTLPAQRNGILTAEFITDFQTKSAKIVFVIPPEQPDFYSILLAFATSVIFLYLAYKLLGRSSHVE